MAYGETEQEKQARLKKEEEDKKKDGPGFMDWITKNALWVGLGSALALAILLYFLMGGNKKKRSTRGIGAPKRRSTGRKRSTAKRRTGRRKSTTKRKSLGEVGELAKVVRSMQGTIAAIGNAPAKRRKKRAAKAA